MGASTYALSVRTSILCMCENYFSSFFHKRASYEEETPETGLGRGLQELVLPFALDTQFAAKRLGMTEKGHVMEKSVINISIYACERTKQQRSSGKERA